MPIHEEIQRYLDKHPDIQSGRAIALIWDIDDVRGFQDPETLKPYLLSEDEAVQILRNVKGQYDPELGVNWRTLERELQLFLLRNPRVNIRGEVAVGTAGESGTSGTWRTMQVEVPAAEYEDKTHEEIVDALERKAIATLEEQGEEGVFVTLLRYDHEQVPSALL